MSHEIGQCDRAAVPVDRRSGVMQLHRLIREHCFQCFASRKSSLGPRPGFVGAGRERNLNPRQTNLAPVFQDKTAPVGDCANLSDGNGLRPAGVQHPAFRARPGRRQNDAPKAAKPRKRDVPAPAHGATKASEWGGTAAVLTLVCGVVGRVVLVVPAGLIVVYFARNSSEAGGFMKIVEIVPRARTRLYGTLVAKEAAIRKSGRGTYVRVGRTSQRAARWKHKKFKGTLQLNRDASERVTAKVRASTPEDERKLLSSFLGFVDRHAGDQVTTITIHYR